MRIIREIIEFDEVVDELVDVDETIDKLSQVRFNLVKDTHDGSYDFTVEIYGDGDPNQGLVSEFTIDTEPLLSEGSPVQGINSKKIPALFDADLLEEIVDRAIPVIWNQGDETEVRINLADPGNAILLPMIR